MPLNYAATKNTPQFTPPQPLDKYPKDSIKKMAVLFTDIVGSSKYFKSHGDIAGRKMLRQHQDIASPAINEHGGVPVKFLGDSVMAYFLNSKEALKSAIKIQKKFWNYNQGKDPKLQIHIRICIHFGNGIVEEKDIFGDVVNMAAKFLPLANGDQIFISQEVYDHVQGLSPIHFEPVEISGKKDLFKGLTLFKVVWDETINLDPLMKILIYFKPIWKLGKNQFAGIWNSLLHNKKNLWARNRIEKESILSDKSIALVVKDASSTLDFAKNVLEFLRVNLGQDGVFFIPIQIIIDTGPYLKAGRLAMEDLKVNWENIEPGEIYISTAVYNYIKNQVAFSINPLPDTNQSRHFHKITLNGHQKAEGHLFSYQSALVQGENPPCFYCGNKRHLSGECPSKQLNETTDVLNKIGYLSWKEINRLYFNYLTETIPNVETEIVNHLKIDKSSQLAQCVFYELKKIYQLRLLRMIWDEREENWKKIMERKNERGKGGSVWIGQDCIRVSSLDQAKAILEDSLQKNPYDYKTHCALGFLNVEKSDFLQAKSYFKKALDYSKTIPQKIFTLFLLSRLYDLNNDPVMAEKSIRKIIHLNPYCLEAQYQDILFQFRKGKKNIALNQLIKLIKNSREYYINALIDPELANYTELIHPKLKDFFNEAQQEANKVIPMAKDELSKLKKLLGEKEKEVMEGQNLCLKIEKLSKSESYFGYLDIIHYADSIINMSRGSIKVRRRKLSKSLRGLQHRFDNCHTFIKDFHYRTFIDPVSRRLRHLHKKINKYWDIAGSDALDKFKEAFIGVKELSSEMDQIELKLKRLDKIQRAILFVTGFFKKSLIFQSVNLLIAIILFPIIAHYLNFFMPDLKAIPQNIWSYQKVVLIFGGAAGIFLAILITTRNMSKE